MRPSHYHYLKRIWTRKPSKKKGNSLLLFPFKTVLFPYKVSLNFSKWSARKMQNLSNKLPELDSSYTRINTKHKSTHTKVGGIFLVIWGIVMLLISGFGFLTCDLPALLVFILISLSIIIIILGRLEIRDSTCSTAKKPSSELSAINTSAKEMSDYDIERYAVMCNAYLEHQDEMEQYNDK